MDDAAILKAITSAPAGVALASVLVYVLYRVLSRVAERWIAALDRVSASVDAHTRVDLEHHAEVREAVVRLETKLDSQQNWRDRTPTERPQRVDLDEDTGEQRRLASERHRKRRTPPIGG